MVSHVTTLTGRALNRQGDAFVSFVEVASMKTSSAIQRTCTDGHRVVYLTRPK